MFFKQLDKIKRNAIMTSIILLFVGLVLIFVPENYTRYVEPVVSSVFLVLFFLSVFQFIGSKKQLADYIFLSAGLFIGLLGVLFFVFDNLFIYFVYVITGLFPIMCGLYWIWQSITFPNYFERKGWAILVLMAIVMIGFGSFVFIYPKGENLNAFLKVIGVTMVFSSLISGIRFILMWPIKKEDR